MKKHVHVLKRLSALFLALVMFAPSLNNYPIRLYAAEASSVPGLGFPATSPPAIGIHTSPPALGITTPHALSVSPAAVGLITITPQNPTIYVNEPITLSIHPQFTPGVHQSFTTHFEHVAGSYQGAWGWVALPTPTSSSVTISSSHGGIWDLFMGYHFISPPERILSDPPARITVRKTLLGISLDPTSRQMNVGESFTITPSFHPSDAWPVSVTWSSSDNSVATVNGDGLVTATGQGTATITAQSTDYSAMNTATVTVTDPGRVTGVSVTPNSATIPFNGTQQLTANILPLTATNVNVIWTTSDSSILSVNSNGLVTGVGEGTAQITGTTVDGGFQSGSTITVLPDPARVTGVSVYPTAVTIDYGATHQPTYPLPMPMTKHLHG